MSPLPAALAGGVSVLLLAICVKPLEAVLKGWRHARRRAWWRKRRVDEAEAFKRQRAKHEASRRNIR